MDPNLNQTQSTPPEQFPPTKAPNEIEETKRVSKKVFLIVSLLLAILIPTSLYLYSRHKNTVSYQTTLAPTPVTQATPTPDPTANWTTYDATGLGFTFKYPWTDWEFNNNPTPAANTSNSYYLTNKSDLNDIISITVYKNNIDRQKTFLNGGDAGMGVESQITNAKLGNKDIIQADETHFQYIQSATQSGQKEVDGHYYTVLIPFGEQTIVLFGDSKDKSIINQIVSTIKFVLVTPTPAIPESDQQTACTQEAKLCPDGSSVGRQGPNCEFSACPIPN